MAQGSLGNNDGYIETDPEKSVSCTSSATWQENQGFTN